MNKGFVETKSNCPHTYSIRFAKIDNKIDHHNFTNNYCNGQKKV